MKRLITTVQNIFKIEELKRRILYTLGLLLIYRIGSFIVLPGIDPVLLEAGVKSAGQKEGILGLLDLFVGGSFFKASVFALGIMPYISASIIMQLLGIAMPHLQKLQREEDGRKKINQYTRYLTILVTFLQSAGYVVNLRSIAGNAIIISDGLFWISTVICLTSGTMLVMYLGERITEKGIGNGTSLIIAVGIISRLPSALFQEFLSRKEDNLLIVFLLELAALFGVIMAVILLTQGTRKIPVQYAKRIIGNKMYGGTRQYIPLKIATAGVMPIIFAQSIIYIPATIAQFFPETASTSSVLRALSDPTAILYNILLALLIILFTYFYTAIIINPIQMADDMKRNGGFIPGVKPGKPTAEYIDTILTRITLPGSLFLAAIAVLPAFARVGGVQAQFADFYGGTSILIVIGVVLDTLQQIESYLIMKKYDGLMQSGRLKGRQEKGIMVTSQI
ncbi:MAG: preprotein translocase subunit SecY [Bacteroidia bacterium]|nr:preprotein translocase subunit SecY [Bacteroidia bacterium]MDW8346914.1 preprotein translocase subunit SecY [Bacteroidia bacterium]